MKCSAARRILYLALLVAPVTVLAQSQSAAPLEVERTVDLQFTRYVDVLLPAVAATKQRIAVLQLTREAAPAVSHATGKPVAVGALLWSVSATGTRIIDNSNGSSASTALLTSNAVRPQAIVEDAARGAIWLYGDALYRYRVATGQLDRFAPASMLAAPIRKAVVTQTGVWLATDGGALMFDDAVEGFRALPASARMPQVNAAVVAGTIWFAADRPRLIAVTPAAHARATIAVSDALPLGVAAEMHAIDDTLWMLLGTKSGHAYRIACLDARGRLDVFRGNYFSLRRAGGELMAGARLYSIDPHSRTAQVRALDSIEILGGVIGTGVTFVGSSYSVKDPSEIVEQRPIDLSRGWSEPERESAAQR